MVCSIMRTAMIDTQTGTWRAGRRHFRRTGRSGAAGVEWPTLILIFAVSAGILGLTLGAAILPLWLVGPALAVLIALHSSLQHEVLHGHPTRWPWLNEALVSLPVGLILPYRRFRDTHLQHHFDPNLTDPYDDPETNYIDPVIWANLPQWSRRLLLRNNTLLGRMAVGPALGLWLFYWKDWRLWRAGVPGIASAYGLHLLLLGPYLWWLIQLTGCPLWLYGMSAYGALSILRIRTFLEHRAHEAVQARTVIVEDRGLLSFLFLNNNLHLVHHAHPQVPWYRLPTLYRARKARYQRQNGGYVYRSYLEVFRRHFLRAKDDVPHPYWSSANRSSGPVKASAPDQASPTGLP